MAPSKWVGKIPWKLTAIWILQIAVIALVWYAMGAWDRARTSGLPSRAVFDAMGAALVLPAGYSPSDEPKFLNRGGVLTWDRSFSGNPPLPGNGVEMFFKSQPALNGWILVKKEYNLTDFSYRFCKEGISLEVSGYRNEASTFFMRLQSTKAPDSYAYCPK